jgi:hypothetical protein
MKSVVFILELFHYINREGNSMMGISCFYAILAFSQINPVAEVEEVVATCKPPGNGAGPFWCYGSPLIFWSGDDVFVSAMETGEDVEPLCNTRWRLFRKHGDGKWDMVKANDKFNQREPCPLVGFPNLGKLFLSVNPSTEPSGTKYGGCDPHLLEFSISEPEKGGTPDHPQWDDRTVFTDHSYRGIAADGQRGEILLLNIHARTGEQFWSFRNSDGAWTNHGRIGFPIRSCYPQVALKNQAGHVLAIGDIVEPNEEWRKYKHDQTGRDWDYVFRRLFYTYTPDITKTGFVEPIELENLDATAGHISNLDMWIDDDGAAHIIYRKQTVQSSMMRDRFFPDTPINVSLEYVVLKEGEKIERKTLLKGGESASSEMPGNARFHITPDDRLLVIYYCHGKDESGKGLNENRILQVLPEITNPVRIDFQEPLGTFFTAIQRGGSEPSDTIHLFGSGRDGQVLRYARVRLR